MRRTTNTRRPTAMSELKKLPPNLQRIRETEIKLGERQNIIIELASSFLNYMALVEHPMNNFLAMDRQIYE